jgi:hypothetical protein
MKWLIGTGTSILALIITWFAWQYPKTPAAPSPQSSGSPVADGSLTSVSPVPQQSPINSLTAGEQQLVSKLKPDLLTSCKGRSDLEGGGVVAAVNCQSVKTGPTKRPLVVRFPGIGSAQAWFRNNTDGFVDQGDCAGGHRLTTWTHKDVAAGTMGCSYTTDGNLRIVWVINNALIGVIASGSDGSAMYNWWKDSGYVVSCGC